ncbi:MAG: hypothetical protein AB1798_14250 [Spirochaetota bacterium]
MRKKDIEREIFSCDSKVKRAFRDNFPSYIHDFCNNYQQAFKVLVKFNRDPENKRHVMIEIFPLNSFNSLLTSMKLLLSGLLVPSGQLMRNFLEFLSIALLWSSPQIDVYEKIKDDPISFSYHKACS